MPWLVTTYLSIYMLLSLSSFAFLLKEKTKPCYLVFELLSACFILLLVSAFFIGSLRDALNPALCAVALALDITLNIKFSLEPRLLVSLPEDSQEFQDASTVIGLIFIAPAYIIAGSLCLSMLFSK